MGLLTLLRNGTANSDGEMNMVGAAHGATSGRAHTDWAVTHFLSTCSSQVALMDGYGHGFIYEHRLGLILVHNLG